MKRQDLVDLFKEKIQAQDIVRIKRKDNAAIEFYVIGASFEGEERIKGYWIDTTDDTMKEEESLKVNLDEWETV